MANIPYPPVGDRSDSYIFDLSGRVAEDDANAITADGSGNAYITGKTDSTDFSGPLSGVTQAVPGGGFDVFVTELSSSGTLVFTTLVGGTGDDIGNAIAVDAAAALQRNLCGGANGVHRLPDYWRSRPAHVQYGGDRSRLCVQARG